MGINGKQIDRAAWLIKLYWRSKCGRTLSPSTDRCHNCGEHRPHTITPFEIVTELEHEHGPTTPALIHAVIDSLIPNGQDTNGQQTLTTADTKGGT